MKIEQPKEIKFSDFISWAFYTLLLGIAGWMSSQFSELNHSVQDLNVKMAVIMTKNDGYSVDIRDLKARVEQLEQRRR